MSWSAELKTNGTHFVNDLDGLETPTNASEETVDQFKEAKACAAEIIRSGVCGNDNCEFEVTLRGHTNQYHAKVKGLARDTLTVTVTQRGG